MSNSIFPTNIITFTSDRTVDFTLRKNESGLNNKEKEFISRQLNLSLPEPVPIVQVHGSKVVVVDSDFLRNRSVLEEADGVITRIANMPLSIRTADCLPVFMYAPVQKGIGLIHVGRRGAKNNIILEAVECMKIQWQTNPESIKVFLGSAIRSCCYEVGKEFQEYFPEDLAVKDGRYYLDLTQICKKQLIDLGLQDKNICDCEICTCCDKNYFSYRREGDAAGRMISLMMLRSGELGNK